MLQEDVLPFRILPSYHVGSLGLWYRCNHCWIVIDLYVSGLVCYVLLIVIQTYYVSLR